jgi:hypothetical protein
VRRHFIEVFSWLPAQSGRWQLLWRVFEVVRNDLVSVTSETLTTIAAERPPVDPPMNLHEMARLRVNDAGNAEWTVMSGPNRRSEVIESEAERQERLTRERVRQAAEKRVDWTRRSDPRRPPTLTYADADGCGNVFVYGWSDDRAEVIAVRANKDVLGLSTAPRTFDLTSQQPALELLVHVYERPVRSWPFCTDAGVQTPAEEVWRLVRGTVTIELLPPGVGTRTPYLYRATIQIVGAELVNAAGVRVRQVQPISLTAIVGGVFG